MATGPKLLLLDEIAGGLTEGECHALVDTIRAIHASGVTIVWIEHVVHALLSVVSRLIVLEFGRKIADGEPMAVMNDPGNGSSSDVISNLLYLLAALLFVGVAALVLAGAHRGFDAGLVEKLDQLHRLAAGEGQMAGVGQALLAISIDHHSGQFCEQPPFE